MVSLVARATYDTMRIGDPQRIADIMSVAYHLPLSPILAA